jgi:hypothetical protein
MMMNIVETGLLGSFNMGVLYTNNAYDEYKLTMMHKEEQDILSKKNQKTTINSTEGQLSAEQTIYLSPLYNNYISMYGMPSFGVGFDPDKLMFVDKLMRLLVSDRPELLGVFYPDEVVAAAPPSLTVDPTPLPVDPTPLPVDPTAPTDPQTRDIPDAWTALAQEATSLVVKKRKKKIDPRLLSPTVKQFYDKMSPPPK